MCVRAAREAAGAENVRENGRPSTGAEDFAYMLEQKPGCYAWLGRGKPGGYALHNPNYDFNDDVIGAGIRYWVNLVEMALGKAG